MNTIIKLALAAALTLFAQNGMAQDTNAEKEIEKQVQIDYLERKKEKVVEAEKEYLKRQVVYINTLLEEGEISQAEATKRKEEAAQKVANNIENKTAIINNQIELVERNGKVNNDIGTQILLGLGDEDGEGKKVFGITYNDGKVGHTIRYDRRTYGELVLAFGLNNAITEDGGDIGDEFSIGRSRFFELGYAWKTRIFKNSGALQFKYGVSLQTNKLRVKDNLTLVETEGAPTFEEFPFELDKSQLRFSNLVVPVHIEFGGWRKEQKDDYVRYRLSGKFRMGIGGYVGVRLGTQQKLKYEIDGNRVKTKERRDFEGDNLVYGLSSYIRLSDDLSLYGKYELSTAFESSDLGEVNNVSLGLRWDW